MKKLIVMLFLFLLGCSKPDLLSCQRTYYIEELGKEINITAEAKFVGGKMQEYHNQYKMNLAGEDEETINDLFQSMKGFYQTEDNSPGIKQSFEKGEDFILYQVVYDITVLEDDNNLFGDKQETRIDLEEEGYICQ